LKPEATQEADSVRIGELADYRYWAFISYSHADKGWGDWLHRALETYRIPKHLVGRTGAFGPVPRRLYPVFRDREELSASSSLGINIERALQQSRSLIVIRSPRSSSSHWVNEEIKYFKSLNREDRILAFMVEGEPNASDGRAGVSRGQECFPEALRFRVGADGELTQERTEPIAGDARKTKDGKLNAKLKLIAGLIGVDYDALKQRDQERRRRYLVALTTPVSAAALAMTGLAIFAFSAEREAQMQAKAANAARDQADGLINFMLTDLRDKLQPIGHLNILSDVTDKARAYLDGLPNEQMNEMSLRQRALMLSNLGQVLQAQGKLSDAVDAYRQELKITQRLVKENGSSADFQSDLSNSYNSLGDALRDMSNLQDAIDALADQDRANDSWQDDLGSSYGKIGDVLLAQGSLSEALDAYQQGLGISKALAEKDKSRADWQHDLSVSYEKLGDVLAAQRKPIEALDDYQRCLKLRQTLADQDRSNGGWQNDLSLSFEKIGDTLKAQGKPAQALTQCQQSLGIRRALVDSDKSNIGWEHDLIALLVKVATTQSLSEGDGKVAEAKALLQEATDLAAEYNGSDQEALIDSINQSSRSIIVGQASE
jgi:eukaryotic-like serine/threonine-protein kinase